MKLVGVSVLGLGLAFALFYLVYGVLAPWVRYSGRFAGFWERRTEAAVQTYQDYVTGRGLTVEQVMGEGDLVRLDTWLIHASRTGIYAENAYASSYITLTLNGTDAGGVTYMYITEDSGLRPIQCADGVAYISFVPSVRYVGLGLGLGAALAGFCAVVAPYIVRLLRRLEALSRETEALMSGDLDRVIHVRGRDELSGLGEDIERMRRSVLERMRGEREAVAANSRLVASLSHDLRTPLTKLTGYLEILAYRKYRTQEEHDGFLRLALEKTAQIKALTDQMFATSQVDAPQGPLERPAEVVDGAALLGQLLEEQCADLRREGFDAQPPAFTRAFQLRMHTADAVRIFDNLFSNLRKYADPATPVGVAVEDGPERVVLRVENRVRPAPAGTDSHGVGEPTMRALMERAGGTLEISRRGDRYLCALAFPKYRENQTGRRA